MEGVQALTTPAGYQTSTGGAVAALGSGVQAAGAVGRAGAMGGAEALPAGVQAGASVREAGVQAGAEAPVRPLYARRAAVGTVAVSIGEDEDEAMLALLDML